MAQQDLTIPVITIDGGARTGKGTARRRVAETLGFHQLDSGVLYRIVALEALKHGGDALHDETQWIRFASKFELGELKVNIAGDNILLDSADATINVTEAVRSEEITRLVPTIAKVEDVRKALRVYQISRRKGPGLVADGRDMGLIFETPHRIFLTASDETCASREFVLLDNPAPREYEQILGRIRQRNRADRTRNIHPLEQHPLAHVIATDNLTRDEVTQRILDIYYSKG